MRQIRVYNETEGTYVWLDAVYGDSLPDIEKAKQYAQELTINGKAAVLQKVKKKQSGFYKGKEHE